MELVKKPILEVREVRYLEEPVVFGGRVANEKRLVAEVDFYVQTTSSNFMNGHWRVELPEGCNGSREELRELVLKGLRKEIV